MQPLHQPHRVCWENRKHFTNASTKFHSQQFFRIVEHGEKDREQVLVLLLELLLFFGCGLFSLANLIHLSTVVVVHTVVDRYGRFP